MENTELNDLEQIKDDHFNKEQIIETLQKDKLKLEKEIESLKENQQNTVLLLQEYREQYEEFNYLIDEQKKSYEDRLEHLEQAYGIEQQKLKSESSKIIELEEDEIEYGSPQQTNESSYIYQKEIDLIQKNHIERQKQYKTKINKIQRLMLLLVKKFQSKGLLLSSSQKRNALGSTSATHHEPNDFELIPAQNQSDKENWSNSPQQKEIVIGLNTNLHESVDFLNDFGNNNQSQNISPIKLRSQSVIFNYLENGEDLNSDFQRVIKVIDGLKNFNKSSSINLQHCDGQEEHNQRYNNQQNQGDMLQVFEEIQEIQASNKSSLHSSQNLEQRTPNNPIQEIPLQEIEEVQIGGLLNNSESKHSIIIQNYEKQIADLVAQIQTQSQFFETSKTQLNEQIAKLQFENEDFVNKVNSLKIQVQDLLQSQNLLNEDLLKMQSENDSLQSELGISKSLCENQQIKIKQIQSDYEKLQDNFGKLEIHKKQINEENQALLLEKNQLAQANQSVQQIYNQNKLEEEKNIKENRQKIQELEEQLKISTEENLQVQNEINLIYESKDTDYKESQALKGKIIQSDKNINRLEIQCLGLKSQLQNWFSENDDFQKSLDSIIENKKQRNLYSVKIGELIPACQKMENSIRKVLLIGEHLDQQIQQVESQNRDLQTQISKKLIEEQQQSLDNQENRSFENFSIATFEEEMNTDYNLQRNNSILVTNNVRKNGPANNMTSSEMKSQQIDQKIDRDEDTCQISCQII